MKRKNNGKRGAAKVSHTGAFFFFSLFSSPIVRRGYLLVFVTSISKAEPMIASRKPV